MNSVRSMAKLHCANCADITLHAANVCQAPGCGAINRDSGNPPVPREKRPYGYATVKHQKYDHAKAEAGEARRRAARARHAHMQQRGRA